MIFDKIMDMREEKLFNDKVKILKDTTVYGQWEFNPTKDITIEKKWEDAKDGTRSAYA